MVRVHSLCIYIMIGVGSGLSWYEKIRINYSLINGKKSQQGQITSSTPIVMSGLLLTYRRRTRTNDSHRGPTAEIEQREKRIEKLENSIIIIETRAFKIVWEECKPHTL